MFLPVTMERLLLQCNCYKSHCIDTWSALEQFAVLCGELYHQYKTSSNYSQCFIHACVFNTVENNNKLLSYKLIRIPQIKGVRT